MINECRDNEIETTYNLSNSVKLQPRAINEKRYSSVIKNTTRNNNIIFKIDFLNPGSYNVREKKYFNAYSQTVISFERQRMDKNRSSQLFPLVESPENAQRLSKTNPVKYDTMKVGMKREAQIFLNGMVKKYLVEKQVRSRDATKCVERPLSIKKK